LSIQNLILIYIFIKVLIHLKMNNFEICDSEDNWDHVESYILYISYIRTKDDCFWKCTFPKCKKRFFRYKRLKKH
jgi:hypothetical protein